MVTEDDVPLAELSYLLSLELGSYSGINGELGMVPFLTKPLLEGGLVSAP